jgi:hypothetical protein
MRQDEDLCKNGHERPPVLKEQTSWSGTSTDGDGNCDQPQLVPICSSLIRRSIPNGPHMPFSRNLHPFLWMASSSSVRPSYCHVSLIAGNALRGFGFFPIEDANPSSIYNYPAPGISNVWIRSTSKKVIVLQFFEEEYP